jgi:hypothetical protein
MTTSDYVAEWHERCAFTVKKRWPLYAAIVWRPAHFGVTFEAEPLFGKRLDGAVCLG